MIDLKRLSKAPYMSRRMYIIRDICRLNDIDLDYLFGLFNLYNKKNRGIWFWQKAALTGALKDNYDNFNTAVDMIVEDLKKADEKITEQHIKSASGILGRLLSGLEADCSIDRKSHSGYVRGFMDKNLKVLISDSLRRVE